MTIVQFLGKDNFCQTYIDTLQVDSRRLLIWKEKG